MQRYAIQRSSRDRGNIVKKEKMEKEFERIMKNIEAAVGKPLIDARFGDNWQNHQRRMLQEKQIDTDDLIRIAWVNGKKGVLMERAIKELLQKIEFIQDQQKRNN